MTAILRAAGYHVGAIDSVAATIGDEELPTGFHTTTPEAPDIQRYLAEMVARGPNTPSSRPPLTAWPSTAWPAANTTWRP